MPLTCNSRSPLHHAAAARAIVPALQTYTKASAIIYAIYALQFFAIPEKFISDHFDVTPDAMHVFLARGSGIAIAGVAYAMHKFDIFSSKRDLAATGARKARPSAWMRSPRSALEWRWHAYQLLN